MNGISAILERKESRVRLRNQLQQEFRHPLVIFTLNIPGPDKTGPDYTAAHKDGERELTERFQEHGIEILRRCVVYGACGREVFLVVKTEDRVLKKICSAIEEKHPLGRLFDMDVYTSDGAAIRREELGKAPRSCYLCEEPAGECARSQRHSADEIRLYIRNMMADYFRR